MVAFRALTPPVEDAALFGVGVFLPQASCDSEANDRVAAVRTAGDAVGHCAVAMRELSTGGNVPSAVFLQRNLQAGVLCQRVLTIIEGQKFLGPEVNGCGDMQDIETPLPDLGGAILRVGAYEPQDGV